MSAKGVSPDPEKTVEGKNYNNENSGKLCHHGFHDFFTQHGPLPLLPEVLRNSCSTGTCDLPDMYACSPWALGIHITLITYNYKIYSM